MRGSNRESDPGSAKGGSFPSPGTNSSTKGQCYKNGCRERGHHTDRKNRGLKPIVAEQQLCRATNKDTFEGLGAELQSSRLTLRVGISSYPP